MVLKIGVGVWGEKIFFLSIDNNTIIFLFLFNLLEIKIHH